MKIFFKSRTAQRASLIKGRRVDMAHAPGGTVAMTRNRWAIEIPRPNKA